jgi:hypothetical protein
MKNDELVNAMGNLTSGIDIDRIKSEIGVNAIAYPFPSDKISLVIVTNEGNSSDKFSKCFEAILRFSAACCEVPLPEPTQASQAVVESPSNQADQQKSGPVTTPGGQELKVWSTEELIQEAQKRKSSLPEGMETWSENELRELSEKRASGLPEGLEMWTEDELKDLAKKRSHGGLDIPEWEPEEDSKECSNCGYTLREGWDECPICGTEVKEKKEEKREESKNNNNLNSEDTSDENSESTNSDNPGTNTK